MNKKLTKLLSVFLIAGVIGTGVAFTATACGKNKEQENQTQTEYTISFNLNGKSATAIADATTSSGKVTAPANPSVSGFTFGGWYEDAACTGTAVDLATKVFTADTTLYAKWTAVSSDVAVTGIALDKTTATIEVDGEVTLTATVSPDNATNKTVTWTSSDTSKATVTGGVVKGVAAGEVTITAKAGDKTATCKVTINPKAVAVTGIALDKTTATVEVDGQVTLTATVSPDNATNKTVTWTSSDETKATVTGGVVKGVAVGEVTITAKAGDETATCTVTINPKTVAASGVTLDKTTAAMEVGDNLTLVATVSPDNATDKTVTWSSSDETKATVDQTGKVTALAVGTVDITAKTANNKTATCTITISAKTIAVESVSLKVGEADATDSSIEVDGALELTAVIAPATATNKNLTWSSSDEKVATVTGGVVVGVAEGKATITVTTEDGNKTAHIEVTVTPKVVHVSTVTFKTATVSIEQGKTSQLVWSVSPDNAANKAVSFSSSDESKVTVNAEGVVTGKAVGSAVITVTSVDGSKTATCTVNVTEVGAAAVPVQSVAITVDNADKESVEIEVDGHVSLDATVTPSNATNSNVTWTSSDEDKVEVDEFGNVTGKAVGRATITVTTEDGSHTDTIEIVVKAKHVAVLGVALDKATETGEVDDEITLTATVTPTGATNQKINWTSSDEDKATVDQTGKVTLKAVGEVTITATSDDDNTKKATCTINVTAKTVITIDETAKVAIGANKQITASASTGKTIVWSSENKEIATVDQATGVVTGVAKGEVKIYATVGNKKEYCTVTVYKGVQNVAITNATSVTVGESLNLEVGTDPEDADEKTVTWSITKGESLATIENGVLTAGYTSGVVTIKAVVDGKEATADIAIVSLYDALSAKENKISGVTTDFSTGFEEGQKIGELPGGQYGTVGFYSFRNGNNAATVETHYAKVEDGKLVQEDPGNGMTHTVISFGKNYGVIEGYLDIEVSAVPGNWTYVQFMGTGDTEVIGIRGNTGYRLGGAGDPVNPQEIYSSSNKKAEIYFKIDIVNHTLNIIANGKTLAKDVAIPNVQEVYAVNLVSSNSGNNKVTLNRVAICGTELTAAEYAEVIAKAKLEKEFKKYVTVDDTDPTDIKYSSETHSTNLTQLVTIYNNALAAIDAKAAEKDATIDAIEDIITLAKNAPDGFASVKSDLKLTQEANAEGLDSYQGKNYDRFASQSIDSTEADGRITTVKSDATTAINAATTIAAANKALDDAKTAIDAIIAEYVSSPEEAIEDITKENGLLDAYAAEKKAELPEGDTITGGDVDTVVTAQKATIAALNTSTTAQIYEALATAKTAVDTAIDTRKNASYTVKYGDETLATIHYGESVTKPETDPVNADNAALKFDKWVTTEGGTTEFDFTAKHYEADGTDIILYAAWLTPDLTVTVHFVGSSNTEELSAYKEDGNAGIKLSALTTSAATGKKFAFYSSYTDADTNVLFNAEDDTAITTDTLDLYAVEVWKSNAEIADDNWYDAAMTETIGATQLTLHDSNFVNVTTDDTTVVYGSKMSANTSFSELGTLNKGITFNTFKKGNNSKSIFVTVKDAVDIVIYVGLSDSSSKGNREGAIYYKVNGGDATLLIEKTSSTVINDKISLTVKDDHIKAGDVIEIYANIPSTSSKDSAQLWLFGVVAGYPDTFTNATIVWKDGENSDAGTSVNINSGKKITAHADLEDDDELGKFLGWADVQNGAAKDVIDFATYRVNPGATVNLYPVYMLPDVTVEYYIPTAVDADTGVHTFGTPDSGTPTEYSGTKLKESTAKVNKGSLAGHGFVAWYTDSALTTEYDFDTPLTAGTLRLYAKYKKVSEQTENLRVKVLNKVNNTEINKSTSLYNGTSYELKVGDGGKVLVADTTVKLEDEESNSTEFTQRIGNLSGNRNFTLTAKKDIKVKIYYNVLDSSGVGVDKNLKYTITSDVTLSRFTKESKTDPGKVYVSGEIELAKGATMTITADGGRFMLFGLDVTYSE